MIKEGICAACVRNKEGDEEKEKRERERERGPPCEVVRI